MPLDTRVAKWGNSLAVRIPHGLAQETGLSEGERITLGTTGDGGIVLRPCRRKYDVRALVAGISRKNRHAAMEWGGPVGRES